MTFQHLFIVGSAMLLLIGGHSRALAKCDAEWWGNSIQPVQPANIVEQASTSLGIVSDHRADAAKAASLISNLWNWVIAQSRYEAPEACPRIVFRSPEHLPKNLCPPGTLHCSIGGYYRDGSGTIIMRGDHRLDDVHIQAMLAHELVHYLQDESGIWSEKSCENKIRREREAYHLQQHYLVAHRGNPFGIRIPVLDETLCAERIN